MRKTSSRRKSSLLIQSLEPRTLFSVAALDQLASLGIRHSVAVNEAPNRVQGPPKAVNNVDVFDIAGVPLLNSRPGAAASIYLDFDGDTFLGFWGPEGNGLRPGITPAYNIDDDATTFSATELSNIQQIWQRVSEYYSPFNINVTTVRPPSFADKVSVQVVIGGDGNWLGPAGGVAYLDAFNSPSTPNVCFVFPDMLAEGRPKFVADAAAHEVGHTLGLEHHAEYDADGDFVTEYDDGNTNVAPIMGVSYYARRGLWAKAPTSSSFFDIQDDLEEITATKNGFGYALDEAGDTLSGAAALIPTAFFTTTASGVIQTNSDADYYRFTTGSGQITFSVTTPLGNMLDPVVQLVDSNGNILVNTNPSGFNASISQNVAAGTYYIVVKGDGTYGDLGQYSLTGSFTSPGAVVGDFVWNDIDGDGVQDAGEPGVAGATVNLFNANNNALISTTTTNESGLYGFSGLNAGDYYVTVIAPDGLVFTTENAGSDDVIDSDFNGAGRSQNFNLAASAVINNLDAGLTTPSLQIFGGTGVEGTGDNSVITFTVRFRGIQSTTQTINYATNSSGTATLGTDFLATSGTLTFAPGETEKTFTVSVVGDAIIENDETIGATITAPSGFPDAVTQDTATVLDDDTPTVTFNTPSVVEGNSGTTNLVYTATLSATSPKTISLLWATANGTAIAGQDYTASSGTLIFAPGQTTQTFSVPVTGEITIEGDETINVNFRTPNAVTLGATTTTGTITSDDLPEVFVSNATITESITGTVDALFTISINVPVAAPVTFTYTTTDGSATAGSDYVAKTGTFTLQPSQVEAFLRIPVNSDTLPEDPETFTLSITGPAGATLGNGTGTATITSQASTELPITSGKTTTYTDFLGNKVAVTLKGPGAGSIFFTGAAGGNDAKTISVLGTTNKSVLVIKNSGAQTSIQNIDVQGSIAKVDAPRVNLLGSFNAAGAVGFLRLNYISNANAVTIGAGDGSIGGFTGVFRSIVDAKFNIGLPVLSFKTNNWLDNDDAADLIAPSARLIWSNGDLQADLDIAGNVTQVGATRNLSSSIIRVDGNIGLVRALTMSNSTIFAGVSDAADSFGLPSQASEFVAASTISRVIVSSKAAGAFSNTRIAATNIGVAALGRIAASIGSPFGLATTNLGNATGRLTDGTAFKRPPLSLDPLQTDFYVRNVI